MDEIVELALKLLGLEEDRNGLVAFAVGLVGECICNYCNLPTVPLGLTYTAATMAAGAYRTGFYGREQPEAQLSSVSRGDASWSFETGASQIAAAAGSPSFVDNYRAQLNAYRKLRW